MKRATFDAANPPQPSDAADLLAQIAKLLNVDDPTDSEAMTQALASLVEAAGGSGADAPTDHIDASAIARGRQILTGEGRKPAKVDLAAIAAGRRIVTGK